MRFTFKARFNARGGSNRDLREIVYHVPALRPLKIAREEVNIWSR